MLERYFVRPETVDRILASWIGPEIERYVAWLAEHGYSDRSVLRRVPLMVAFGEFAERAAPRQSRTYLLMSTGLSLSGWRAGRHAPGRAADR